MSATPAHPVLRLITTDAPKTQRMSHGRNVVRAAEPSEPAAHPFTIAHEQVRAENASAATVSMSALDPRWVMAVQVSREMQGGRAAVITPEARQRLLSTGRRLGLRPFDSNLVIAMVQDGARSGEDPLGRDVIARLRLVNPEPALDDAKRGPTWSQLVAWTIVVALSSSTLTTAAWLFLIARPK